MYTYTFAIYHKIMMEKNFLNTSLHLTKWFHIFYRIENVGKKNYWWFIDCNGSWKERILYVYNVYITIYIYTVGLKRFYRRG